MSNNNKLSLTSLILISINIMLGSGIFINTVALANIAGSLSPLIYTLVGILLLPLILAISNLWQSTNGACTFYHFGLSISPFFGFLASWSYFISKISSFALGIHICISLLKKIIPLLNSIETLALDFGVILLFTLLNLFNLRTGMSIQFVFLIFKLVPIFFVIFSGMFLFSASNFSANQIPLGIPAGIPLVLFAFAGFEASCSLSQHIENPEKNGPKAILFSYAIVVLIATLFQFILYGNIGSALGYLTNGYLDVYPTLVSKLVTQTNLKNILIGLMHIAIASSALGAAYGIMFSNSWNLYTLAQNKHVFFKKTIGALNNQNIAYVCIIIEAVLGVIYLLLTQGQQIPLQQVSALGGTIAYSFSAIAFFIVKYKELGKITLLPTLAILSCILLLSSFIWNINAYGVSSLLILFLALLVFGSYMFFRKHEPHELDIYEQL